LIMTITTNKPKYIYWQDEELFIGY